MAAVAATTKSLRNGGMMDILDPPPESNPTARLVETELFGVIDNEPSPIEPLPAVVHFGGFEVGKTHQLKLKLLNKGTSIRKLHVVNPTTLFFACHVVKQDNGLYPGFSDEVQIEFTPQEWRYYYDCIRVHVEDGANLLIPIHGYPVPGNVEIPKSMDFGFVPVGHSVHKRIPLKCNVPIAFDFSVTVLETSPFMTVTPLHGTIPANGSSYIEIAYTPQSFNTTSCKFAFRLEQYNASPVQCVCMGSCKPGLAKDEQIKKLTGSVSTASAPTSPNPRPSVPSGSAKRRRASQKKIRKSQQSQQEPPTREVDGVKIPSNMRGIAAVNFMLNQPPAAQAAGAAIPRHALLEGSMTHTERCLAEKRFQEEIDAFRSQSHPHGDAGVAEDVAARVEAAWVRGRADLFRVIAQQGDEAYAKRVQQTETTSDLVLYRTVRRVTGTGSEDIVTPSTAVQVSFQSMPHHGWRHRSRLLQLFVTAARTIVLRNRAEARLVFLRQWRSQRQQPIGLGANEQEPEEEHGQDDAATRAATGGEKAVPLLLDAHTLDNQTWKMTCVEKIEQAFLSISADQIVDERFPVREPPSVFGSVEERKEVPVPVPTLPTPTSQFWNLEVPWEYRKSGYHITRMEPTPHVPACDESTHALVPLPPLAIRSEATPPDHGGILPLTPPPDLYTSSVHGRAGAALAPFPLSVVATETLPHAEHALDHELDPLAVAIQAARASADTGGASAASGRGTGEWAAAGGVHHAPVAPCAPGAALRVLLPAGTPGFARPFEDLLPNSDDGVDDHNHTDEEEEQASKLAFEHALQALAASPGGAALVSSTATRADPS